jgi:hypothetical protein
MKANALVIGLLLSWLVSPESLAIFGRGIGVSGMMIIAPLAAAAVLSILCAHLIHGPGTRDHQTGFAVLSTAYGRIIAAAMALAGRIPVFLLASTAMLVSAGFAFNEIFVHWFPNFLFASLLLLIICGLHLFRDKAALWGQAVFAGIAVLGLLILMAMGLDGSGEAVAKTASPPSLSYSLFGMIFLLFLGFDFHRPGKQRMTALYLAPGLAFALLAGWAWLAVEHVPLERLAGSSLPHILIARAVGGDTGGYIIGAVVISGALSGVNGFLLALRKTLEELAENRFFPKIAGKGRSLAVVSFVLIETMMMTGVAGDEGIDTMVRASLLLWLMYVGFRSFAAGIQGQSVNPSGKLYAGAVAGMVFFLAGSLIPADSRTGDILWFQSCIILGFLAFSFTWVKARERFMNKHINREE